MTGTQHAAGIREMVEYLEHADYVEALGGEKSRAHDFAGDAVTNVPARFFRRRPAGFDAADSSPAVHESLLEKESVAAPNLEQGITLRTKSTCDLEVFAVGALEVRQFRSIGKCTLAIELFQCGAVGDRI